MAVVTAVAVGTAAVVGGGLVQANQAKQAAKGFKNEKQRKEWEIKQIEENRQAIPNPYANVTDLSGLATDLTSMMGNPFASLGVATQAAEFQAEEADTRGQHRVHRMGQQRHRRTGTSQAHRHSEALRPRSHPE